jgi:hypothetical protein
MAVGFSKFLVWLKDYWFIIIFIGSLIYTFGQVQWTIQAHSVRDDTQDQRIQRVEVDQQSIKESIVEIKTSLNATNQNTERTLRILEGIQFN